MKLMWLIVLREAATSPGDDRALLWGEFSWDHPNYVSDEPDRFFDLFLDHIKSLADLTRFAPEDDETEVSGNCISVETYPEIFIEDNWEWKSKPPTDCARLRPASL